MRHVRAAYPTVLLLLLPSVCHGGGHRAINGRSMAGRGPLRRQVRCHFWRARSVRAAGFFLSPRPLISACSGGVGLKILALISSSPQLLVRHGRGGALSAFAQVSEGQGCDTGEPRLGFFKFLGALPAFAQVLEGANTKPRGTKTVTKTVTIPSPTP